MSLTTERRVLYTLWIVAIIAGVFGGPFIAIATGQPGVIFFIEILIALGLGFWHSSFRRRSRSAGA